jgi:two-component system response regulator RstA
MHSNAKIDVLVVEDDRKISFQIQRYLTQQGFNVDIERNGADAVVKIINMQPKIVILDLMLPELDGFGVCKKVRPHFKGDILMLTASDDEMNQVVGIELGVDDYVVKPIHPRVLLARIQLLLRKREIMSAPKKTAQQKSNKLQIGQLDIHKIKRTVHFLSEEVNVTSSEFDVLLLLAEASDQTISRDQLLQQLRGIEYDGLDRTIDMKVASLRKKLHDDSNAPFRIVTVRSKGYVLCSDSWETL